jgi:hypothetical protein
MIRTTRSRRDSCMRSSAYASSGLPRPRSSSPNHSARITAQNARVPAEVRVVRLREASRRLKNTECNSRDWHFRWIVRMHKIRQWYPSEQRHKVIYRGPYVKGPDGKPLLAGEVIKSVDS